MAKKTDDDPNFSACRLIFITPLTTAGYENKIDSDSAEHTAANYATNTASEESCHQYIDNDGIAVIDLADKHRSKTRKNNTWITTVKPFTDNGDDVDCGSDETGAQKLEKRTPYNAWGPIPGDSAPPTDTVTDQKSFSMVEPFVPPSDDDDDDDVGGDDESGVNTPLFVRASQLISDHKSTALRRQVAENASGNARSPSRTEEQQKTVTNAIASVPNLDFDSLDDGKAGAAERGSDDDDDDDDEDEEEEADEDSDDERRETSSRAHSELDRQPQDTATYSATVAPTDEHNQSACTTAQEHYLKLGQRWLTDPHLDVSQTIARDGVVLLQLRRKKSSLKVGSVEAYLETAHGTKFFVIARRRVKVWTPTFIISSDSSRTRRSDHQCLGILRCNVFGRYATLYDNGVSPHIYRTGRYDVGSLRQELAAICFEADAGCPYGAASPRPRRITVILPALDDSGQPFPFRPIRKSESLRSRYKRGNTGNLIVLKNKIPHWDNARKTYIINFNGRVDSPSVKNFQIASDSENRLQLQLGRVGRDQFILDYSHPFSGLQAFAIAVSAIMSSAYCD